MWMKAGALVLALGLSLSLFLPTPSGPYLSPLHPPAPASGRRGLPLPGPHVPSLIHPAHTGKHLPYWALS